MKKFAFTITLFCLCMLLASCAQGLDSGSKFPTGIMVLEVDPDIKLEFKEDGTYLYSSGNDILSIGTYTVRGNKVTWTSDSYCDWLDAGQATYRWTYKEFVGYPEDVQKIFFEKIGEDKCTDRSYFLHLSAFLPQK